MTPREKLEEAGREAKARARACPTCSPVIVAAIDRLLQVAGEEIERLREGAHDANCDCHHAWPDSLDIDRKCIATIGGLLCGMPGDVDLHPDPRCLALRQAKSGDA